MVFQEGVGRNSFELLSGSGCWDECGISMRGQRPWFLNGSISLQYHDHDYPIHLIVPLPLPPAAGGAGEAAAGAEGPRHQWDAPPLATCPLPPSPAPCPPPPPSLHSWWSWRGSCRSRPSSTAACWQEGWEEEEEVTGGCARSHR